MRTTPAQQAGLTAHLLERIIPSSAPSHNLPPPAHIWAGLLATWGKPLNETQINADVSSTALVPQPGKAGLGTNAQAELGAENLHLPDWISKGSVPQEIGRAEMADAAWVDQLLQDLQF